MAKLASILAIFTILCCLCLPIHGFNRTRSFRTTAKTEPLIARSKYCLYAVGLINHTISMIDIDGSNEYTMCSLSNTIVEVNSDKKTIASLGNGKIVVSTPTSGEDEDKQEKVHSYIIVDPRNCSTLVEFETFAGLVVPYLDSFDIVYQNSVKKIQRFNDKGQLMHLDREIGDLDYDKCNMKTIKKFDGSSGYFCEGKKLLRLDSDMKPKAEYLLHDDQVLSVELGNATSCYRGINGNYVCELMNADLKLQANVTLSNTEKDILHTVNNLPGGGAIVVITTHVPDITNFYGVVIKADGTFGKYARIASFTIGEEKTLGFVMPSGEFCIVITGKKKDYEAFKSFANPDQHFIVTTRCVDLKN